MRSQVSRYLSGLIAAGLLVATWAVVPVKAGLLQREPAIAAHSAILVEQESGKVLYAKSETSRMYPASLTKLLTALVVMKYAGDLDSTVAVGEEVQRVEVNSSLAGLYPGDRISLRDLLYGMLLPSGNDAAYAAAVYTARVHLNNRDLPVEQAVRSFVGLMNQMAQQIGATHSKFANPDGYHDPEHYTTASDLALISGKVMKQDFLRQVVSQETQTVNYLSQGKSVFRNWSNSNKLLSRYDSAYYRYATGLKTGTTPEAGYCLAAAASSGQLNLIAIILNGSEEGRWQDSRQLLDYGFQQYQYLELCRAGNPQLTVRVSGSLPGLFASSKVVSKETAGVVVNREDVGRIIRSFAWQRAFASGSGDQVTVRSGTAAGTVVGRLIFTLDKHILADVPLALGSGVLSYRPGWLLFLVPLSIIILVVLARRRRQRSPLRRQ